MVGSVIQFTLGGGSTCHFSIVTDTVVFGEAKVIHTSLSRLPYPIMAPHVRHIFGYISLPFSTKQQHEMTNFKVLWGT